MTYEKHELIEAMKKYNVHFLNRPEDFADIGFDDDSAVLQINYLLTLVDTRNKMEEEWWKFDLRKPSFYKFLVFMALSIYGTAQLVVKLISLLLS